MATITKATKIRRAKNGSVFPHMEADVYVTGDPNGICFMDLTTVSEVMPKDLGKRSSARTTGLMTPVQVTVPRRKVDPEDHAIEMLSAEAIASPLVDGVPSALYAREVIGGLEGIAVLGTDPLSELLRKEEFAVGLEQEAEAELCDYMANATTEQLLELVLNSLFSPTRMQVPPLEDILRDADQVGLGRRRMVPRPVYRRGQKVMRLQPDIDQPCFDLMDYVVAKRQARLNSGTPAPRPRERLLKLNKNEAAAAREWAIAHGLIRPVAA